MKLRPAIRNLLKGNPNVHHYTESPAADKLFVQHPILQQAEIESQRRSILEGHISELKHREMVRIFSFEITQPRRDSFLFSLLVSWQQSREACSRSIGKLVNLFKELQVDVLTKRQTAYSTVLESEARRTYPEIQKLPTMDILLAFEDYSLVRERGFRNR